MTTNLPIFPQLHQPESLRNTSGKRELELGQIIFGKVMRVQENGHYQVDIHGRQYVVDKAVPLKQDEVFRGKIVGLGEHLVLEKMLSSDRVSDGSSSPSIEIDTSDLPLRDAIAKFVETHQKVFEPRHWNQLLRAANHAKHPISFLSYAVYLQKIGLPSVPSLAAKLSHALLNEPLHPILMRDALEISTSHEIPTQESFQVQTLQLLADFLLEKTEASVDEARSTLQQSQYSINDQTSNMDTSSDENSDPSFNQALLHWLLNVQADGSASHRVVVLPFIVDGALVELEMTLLDQQSKSEKAADLKSKLIHLSLDTEFLGKVSATINVVNSNLHIHFSTESETSLQQLALHRKFLSAQLEQMNHRIDEMSFMQAFPNDMFTARPVVDYVIRNDSLSILV